MKQWERDISENLKVGLLDLMILKLLSQEDMYGYQIKQTIAKITNNNLEIKEGSLYGPFYRLDKKGLITSYKTVVGQKRYRVYYKLTKLGQDYLACGLHVYNDIITAVNKVLL